MNVTELVSVDECFRRSAGNMIGQAECATPIRSHSALLKPHQWDFHAARDQFFHDRRRWKLIELALRKNMASLRTRTVSHGSQAGNCRGHDVLWHPLEHPCSLLCIQSRLLRESANP